MPSHKFRLGQMVGLNLSRRGREGISPRNYKILALLPRARGVCSYRIKTITEACARIATESELVGSSST